MDNEFMENYNSEPSNKHKKEKSILKKIYKSLINIFAVMGLAVKCGQEITLKTDGENEEEAMNKLSAFLEENL